MSDNNLPNIIWFLWMQGIDNAPVEVKKCYQSWVKFNPGWQINLLDDDNLKDYIRIDKLNITKQAFSDVIRINLLAKYGGVWVDATCFCMKPLDEWLAAYMTQGFFAFERPGADRMLSSWFLASGKQNYLTDAYQKRVNLYWEKNPGMKLVDKSRWNFLNKRIQDKDPQLWINSFFLTKVLKLYPYFWFHYLFENIYLADAHFRRIWDAVPKISADIPHALLFAGITNPVTKEIKSVVAQKIAPLYKLTWKYDASQYKAGTVMEYLFRSMLGDDSID